MDLRDYRIDEEPYYRAIDDGVRLFEAAYADRVPMMFEGPIGAPRREGDVGSATNRLTNRH
jgi:hypothetical protein